MYIVHNTTQHMKTFLYYYEILATPKYMMKKNTHIHTYKEPLTMTCLGKIEQFFRRIYSLREAFFFAENVFGFPEKRNGSFS